MVLEAQKVLSGFPLLFLASFLVYEIKEQWKMPLSPLTF